MMRADLRRRLLARGPLARTVLVLAPLMAFAVPAGAQTSTPPVSNAAAAHAPAATIDPWSGLLILITPPAPEAADESPYETAQRENAAAPDDAAPEPVAPIDAVPEQAESDEIVGHVVSSNDLAAEAPRPSIWNALGFGGPIVPTIQQPAPNTLLPARTAVRATTSSSLPTRFEVLEGPASVAVSTSASTSAPVSSPLAKSAGGGSGEVKTRIGYEVNNLTLYGTGGLGAAESTGAVSVYDSVAVGSSYKVPLGIVTGDSLGATVEVNNTAAVTTGVEIRAPLGDYQRFISVQRSAAPNADASGMVKAGVLGKF